MGRKRNEKPRLHKASGRAFIELGGKRIYLEAAYGTKEAEQEYDRLWGQWLANDRKPPPSKDTEVSGVTCGELAIRYLDWAEKYHIPKDGEPAKEYDHCRRAIGFLTKHFRDLPAVKFTALSLEFLQEKLSEHKAKNKEGRYSRPIIRKYINIIRDVFKRGVKYHGVPAEIHYALLSHEHLKRGKTKAHEHRKSKPVLDEIVDKTLPFMTPIIADTGATITGLKANMAYDFRLTATNADGSASSITSAETWGKIIVTDKTEIDNKAPTVKGVKKGVATETTITLIWKPKAKDFGKHADADTEVILIEIYALKPKGKGAVAPLIATVTIDVKTGNYISKGATATVTGNSISGGFTIEVKGLDTGTKYTVQMQAKRSDGDKPYSKITKTTATTKKYAAPKKGTVTDKGLGTATISLKGTSNVTKASDTVKNGFKVYEVGILVNGVWLFGNKADAYWASQGIAVDYSGNVDGKATITGLGGQKYTFGIREIAYTGTTEADKGAVFATSAIATFSVQPAKYAAVKNNGSTGTQLQWKANDAVAKPADTEDVTYQKSYEVGIYSGTAVVFPGDANWE